MTITGQMVNWPLVRLFWECAGVAAAVFTLAVPTAWVVIRTLRMCRK